MAQNMLTFPEVAKALRKGKSCELKDGGSLSLKVTGKNAGKWLYRGRKKGDRTLIDPEFPGCFYYHGSNSAEDLY